MCQCCLASFQNGIQFVSRNAYIETGNKKIEFMIEKKIKFSLI